MTKNLTKSNLTKSDVKKFTDGQAKAFKHLDILVPTMSGNLRGKRIPFAEINKLIDGKLTLPLSAATMDAAGETPLLMEEGYLDGDPDVRYLPIKGTLAPVAWDSLRAQVLIAPDHSDEFATPYQNPRNILQKIITKFHKQNLIPQAAIELEFFLIDPVREKNGLPIPPKSQMNKRKVTAEQCLHMQALEDFQPFLKKLTATLEAQHLEPQAISAEYSRAQFEINQPHSKDLLSVCDKAVLLKRAVKTIAATFGLEATFMAKPYLGQPGSGTHIHISMLDAKGNNIFATKKIGEPSQKFLHAIGGLSKTTADFFALLAPLGNSYRRFCGGVFAPVNTAWGRNNRTVALRIPPIHDLKDMRVEHRIAGADACPYLVMAAVLCGIDYGLQNKISPPRESLRDKIYQRDDVPLRWGEALYRFKKSKIAMGYLGVDTHRFLHSYFASEYEAYHNYMPRRDIDRYLEAT